MDNETLPECAKCQTIRCSLHPEHSTHYPAKHCPICLKELNPKTKRCENYFGAIRLAFSNKSRGV